MHGQNHIRITIYYHTQIQYHVFCYRFYMKYFVIVTKTQYALMKLHECLKWSLGEIFLLLTCPFKLNKSRKFGLLVRRILYVIRNGLKGTGTLYLCVYLYEISPNFSYLEIAPENEIVKVVSQKKILCVAGLNNEQKKNTVVAVSCSGPGIKTKAVNIVVGRHRRRRQI